MKPELTEEQKQKFETEFNALIARASSDIKATWNGELTWVGDMPLMANNPHLKLKGRLAFEYVDLKAKLDERTL